MKLELTDEEVKRAIYEWLLRRIPDFPPMSMLAIRRLYYNEGSGFEAVIEPLTE